ncbi:MAG TPA: RsmE family RNA methyltransferase [Gemmatimonadales bacterium]|nr:RsmE family RNA methyltransferase [Gemmatimonadales bacterium]
MITLLVRRGHLVAGATVTLEPEELHHLEVRRIPAEMRVRLLDGGGRRGEGQLRGSSIRPEVYVEQVFEEPAPVETCLAVGAGDRDRFAVLAEQATQLGATRIIPLETARTANVATRLRGQHLDRIRRRAREALKQCGALWSLEVEEPLRLTEFLDRPHAGARWLADAAGGSSESLGADTPLTVVIGPEGGFATEEAAALRGAGFIPVRLGPHVLRFETAALAALTTAWHARQRGSHG